MIGFNALGRTALGKSGRPPGEQGVFYIACAATVQFVGQVIPVVLSGAFICAGTTTLAAVGQFTRQRNTITSARSQSGDITSARAVGADITTVRA